MADDGGRRWARGGWSTPNENMSIDRDCEHVYVRMDPETVTWRFQSETPSGLLLEHPDGGVEELTLSHALDLFPQDRERLIDEYEYALFDALDVGLTEARQADGVALYAELAYELEGPRLAAELASRGWTPQLRSWAHSLFCPFGHAEERV